ncbi:MAG: GH25 family lysozyme [Clostridiales bacterium]|nr:GH25 family lysozyme [Clostridiales bacterium]
MKKLAIVLSLMIWSLVFTAGPIQAQSVNRTVTSVSSSQSGGQLPAPVLSGIKTVSYQCIKISWRKVASADGYRIYRKTSGTAWKPLKNVDSSTLSYKDKTVEPGTTYYYTVAAYKKSGKKITYGKYSNSGIYGKTSLETPKLSGITADSETIRLKWKAVPGADLYYVYRRLSNGNWSKIASKSADSSLSYTDKNAILGTTYNYTVRAVRNVGSTKVKSDWDKNGLSAVCLPDTPKLVEAKASGDTGFLVAWEAVKNADGYRVYRKMDGGKWKAVISLEKDILSYHDESALAGVSYQYTVRAYQLVSGSTITGGYDENGLSASRPIGTVKLVSADSSKGSQAILVWESVPGINGYYVYRKDNGKWVRIADITEPDQTSFMDEGLTMGNSYTYTVKAYSQGTSKKYYGGYEADGISVTIVAGAPKLKNAQYVDSQSVELTWSKVGDVDGYRIYRSVDGGKFKKLADVKKASVTSYVDETAKVGSSYSYKVCCYNTVNGEKILGFKSSGKEVHASIAIDVSKWNKTVDWEKVRAAGIEIAMIKIGSSNNGGLMDECFEENIRQAKEQGIRVGVYFYSYAQSLEDVQAELDYFLPLLEPYRDQLDLPVAYDFELESRQKEELKEENTAMICMFCDGLEEAGYDSMVYSGAYMFDKYIDYEKVYPYGIWLARYYGDNTLSYDGYKGKSPTYIRDFGAVNMWQYSTDGSIDGISTKVDLNVCYLP